MIEEKKYAKVAVNLPFSLNNDDCFYYLIPEEIKEEIKAGTIVHIPFGKQELKGFVLDTSLKEIKSKFQIKPIYEVLHKKPIWNEKFIELAQWISKHYLTNIGTVLAASISTGIIDDYINEVELIKEINELPSLNNEEHFIINKLAKSKSKSLSYRFLMQKSKFNKQRFYQLINQLKNKEIIRSKIKYIESKKRKSERGMQWHISTSNIKSLKHLVLNKEQENAYTIILNSIKTNNPTTFLLHGVTGSGKTEVYLKLIEEVLKNNKTIIYLVPEIYLISQIYERLINRFDPSLIILWHSSLSKNERISYWEKIQNDNKPKIILGARSAILSPIANIGLIVIDEAHDASYKQASPTPRYDAIKTAIKRGEIERCPVILGTATPNITDYYFCKEKNTILELPNRIENVPMPKVNLINLSNEFLTNSKNIISTTLKNNITEALNKNEQTILLLNRRGYSSHVFCRVCGYIKYCKNCSVPLVFHKNLALMICHHCGFQEGSGSSLQCPECKSPHFKYFGLGTQQLEEEVKTIFQGARILRVDSDQLKRKDQYINLWREFAEHKADILIGTQVVAKGLDLPNVTVVGVILADTMFNFPDYISHERAFQLLTQVTGRAGRGQKPGKVFIQTYQIENPLFKFILEHDFKSFYDKEIKQREEFSYPPYTILTRLIFQAHNEKDCIDFTNEMLKELSAINTEQPTAITKACFLGPAPCFFTKLHGKYRYHILCKIKDEETKIHLFNELFQRTNKNAKVDLIVDVDSVNLL